MTEVVRCQSCDFMLYFGENISDRLHHRLSEEKVLQYYGNVCPRCRGGLSKGSVSIRVSQRGEK